MCVCLVRGVLYVVPEREEWCLVRGVWYVVPERDESCRGRERKRRGKRTMT